MKKKICIEVTVILCLLLAGCHGSLGYEVKSTGGLRVACEKILLANSLVDVTSARKDLTEDTRKPLIDSYNNAASSVNLFLDDIEEKSVNVVDVPLSAFYTNIASSDLDRFISDAVASAKKHRGQDAKVGQSVESERQRPETERQREAERQRMEEQRFRDIVVSADAKLRGILELNGKESGESYKRFRGLIDSLKMTVRPLQKP